MMRIRIRVMTMMRIRIRTMTMMRVRGMTVNGTVSGNECRQRNCKPFLVFLNNYLYVLIMIL